MTELIAVQFVDGTQSMVSRNSTTGATQLNVKPAKVFKPGETSWAIPALSQAAVSVHTPTPELID